ncbi:MAG: glycosyltransferase family 2 protein [Rhodospirillales bacterium]|nr:glycosyltransferase family 2 protein [Rhodospirillales bacterium]
MSADKPRITIITPIYNEEAGLEVYYEAVSQVLISRDDAEYHVLLIDDGSTDASWHLIESICARSPRFQGLRLSRNFGAHAALSAGIDHAEGDAVATLACDLQDPPETIIAFTECWRAGAEVVWGRRRSREDTGWRVLTSQLFFTAIRRHAMPRGSKFSTGSFFLIDRKVVECFRRFRETNRITFALVAWTGFEQDVVLYDRRQRTTGTSGWTFGRMIKAMYDVFIGFSDLPARLITLAGGTVSLLSMLLAVYLLVNYLVHSVLPGWTGVMLALTTFFGLLFLILGIVGEYLHRIYTEVTGRPVYFISRQTGKTRGHD